jgi:D-alanyl-D-alanine carboxypeptidase
MDMTRRTTLVSAVAAAVIAAASSRAAIGDLAPAIEAIGKEHIRRRRAAGMALQVQRGKNVLYSGSFGSANLETATEVKPDTVFRIASVSKQFTAASVLLLAEDGKLSLDDKLAEYIPDFPRAAEVSLRQLLNHTSGIQNITRGVIPSVDYTTAQLVEVIKSQSPLYGFDPGTRWAYSNTAFDLAGAVIERVTSAPFYEFFRKRLFPRADMKATDVDFHADIVPHRASGYTVANTSTGFINAEYLSWTIPGAAGCLRSTVIDLARWHDALFHGRILNAESLREMTTPARLKDGRLASLGRSGPAAGTQPVQEYGLGLELSLVDGKKRCGHYGSILGFGADMGTFPELDLTIVALTNTDFGPVNPPRSIDDAVLKTL